MRIPFLLEQVARSEQQLKAEKEVLEELERIYRGVAKAVRPD
jgi:hypothetical protein